MEGDWEDAGGGGGVSGNIKKERLPEVTSQVARVRGTPEEGQLEPSQEWGLASVWSGRGGQN